MHRILVAGAGHIGSLVAELLTATDCYRVTIVDRDELALGVLAPMGWSRSSVSVAPGRVESRATFGPTTAA